MSKVDLSKFSNEYVMELEGILKTFCVDDYEQGESTDSHCTECDFLNTEFILDKEKVTKEYLTNLIVEHLKSELYLSKIEESWIMVTDNRIILSMHEYEDASPIEDVMKAFKDGEKVFACYYHMSISINGKELEEDDLIDLFNFEY